MNINKREFILKDEVYALVGAVIEFLNNLRNGFLEPVYQEALDYEFSLRGIPFVAQNPINIVYKDKQLEKNYIADFLCYDEVVIDIKALTKLTSQEESQLLNYLKATGKLVGVLLNFGKPNLEWKRMVSSNISVHRVNSWI
ncbi:MAG: GxxExxY protein [Verrucomicrobiota bacterium]